MDAELPGRAASCRQHVVECEAIGSEQIEAIRYRTSDGRESDGSAEMLLVHEGVVPNMHAADGAWLRAWNGATIRIARRRRSIGGARQLAGKCSSPATEPASPVPRQPQLRGELAAIAHRRKARPHRRMRERAGRRAAAARASAASWPCGRSSMHCSGRDRQIFAPQTRRSSVAARSSPRATSAPARGRAAGTQSGKGVHPRRHGAVPGPAVRLHRHPHARRGGEAPAGRGRLLSRPPAAEAGHARRARRAAAGDGRDAARTPT